jgi:hypothetical protein
MNYLRLSVVSVPQSSFGKPEHSMIECPIANKKDKGCHKDFEEKSKKKIW